MSLEALKKRIETRKIQEKAKSIRGIFWPYPLLNLLCVLIKRRRRYE
ncbi:MAG: hypothetical protein QMD13_08005 [Candidatus Bathyarchaeia archaeon]|nr:hypothetical protein [Candidatus Bathyarchaeia archaeon]